MAREQGGNPSALYSSPTFKSFTSFAADIDLQDTSAGIGMNCRRIRCQAAGKLVVMLRDGTTATLQFAAGESQDVVVQKIVLSGSTVTCDASNLITAFG